MTPEHKIYMAGPISGLNYDQAAHGWRGDFYTCLSRRARAAFRLYSPLRGKDFLAERGALTGSYEDHPLATESGIITRDRNDVRTCDLMVACFTEAAPDVISIGTVMEFGWADAWRKPIIMVATEDCPHRHHPMMRATAGYIVDNLEDAAKIAETILLH